MSKREPKIRFKGFTDEWEEHRLVDYFSERIERSSTGNMLSVTISEGIVLASSLDRKDNSSADKKNYKLVKVNDIAYNSMRMWQAALGVSNYEGIVSPAYTVLIPNDGVNSNFFGYQFKQTKMKRIFQRNSQGLTSDTWNLKYPLFSKILTSAPSFDEQSEIGYFFKKLDKLITSRQKQLDLLKEQKKGFLQKMFPKAGEIVPELRFQEFLSDWKASKLRDITERITRKNKNNETRRPLTISAQDGLIDQNDFFNKQVASRDVSGYFLVKNGDFAYNKSYSNGYQWGAIKRLDRYDMGVLSTIYIVFRPTNVSSQFLVAYYDTTKWYREVARNATEGARNHGLLNISPVDFFNTVLVIPGLIEEQERIGLFFKRLDDSIMFHQRQVVALQKLKKGFLQHMFI